MFNKENLYKLFFVALSGALVWLFTALNLFFGNPMGFVSLLSEVMPGLLIFFVMLFIFLALAQLPFVKSRYFEGINLFFFFLGFCGWLQANILLWPSDNVQWRAFGRIQGMVVRNHNVMYFVLEFFIYAAIIYLFIKFNKFLSKNIYRLVAILIVVQIINLAAPCMNYDEKVCSNKFIVFDDQHQFYFSEQQNVIILVLDAFGEDFFQDILVKNKGLEASAFQDFNHFSHFLSPIPWTQAAIPTLLTGSSDLETRPDGFLSSHQYLYVIPELYDSWSLLPVLSRNGYDTQAFPMIKETLSMDAPFISNLRHRNTRSPSNLLVDHLVPLSAYRLVPLVFKSFFLSTTTDMQWALYGLYVGKQETQNPNDHVQNPYVDPFFIQMQNIRVEQQPKRFIFYHLRSIHDDSSVAKPYIDGTARFLELLKEKNVYDNSYIVILGDHGSHEAEHINYHHNPFLLIKKPNQHFDKMQENDEIVLMRDIAPTVLSDLGLAAEDGQKVYSLWNFSEAQKKERREYWKRLMPASMQ